jgi:hypothetical protein
VLAVLLQLKKDQYLIEHALRVEEYAIPEHMLDKDIKNKQKNKKQKTNKKQKHT